ncbi:ATP-binding protein [Novosphingobium sp. Chol11]|uniref:ATP-binding protein n=1 Tax=Novosphingobium sp. Chol11 TaxID=1385763 RepID=UPI0025FDE190|nr:ATP-binding protein [Novosphingobium sp. Chol11]
MRLSTQLAGIIAASTLTCAAIIIFETELFEAYESWRLLHDMPPAAKQAAEALIAGREPAMTDLQALIKFQLLANDGTISRSNLALLMFVLTAVIGVFIAGTILLGRLGSGLDSLAEAARMVTKGELSARAPLPRFASIEETQLIDDFNVMASALERVDRELKDSTAAIAHELRTPLTVLSGRLHGIQDGVFEPEADQIESLIKQVDSLARIVDDLRTLSLANSAQLALDLASIDLAEVLRPTLAAMAPDLNAAGIAVDADLRPAPLIGDAARLRQALGAVLTNVQRYAAGSEIMKIETGTSAGWAFVRVLDRGIGLTDEASARAFERFWRGEQSRGRANGGSGLGLSVVRAIAEAHRGEVTLTSRAGGGATFEMLLPQKPLRVDTFSTKG